MERARFRYNVSICLAGILGFIGAIPLATAGFGHEDVAAYAYVLVLILLIPLAVAIWGWRAGTDADADGLRVRALLASRRIPWADVETLAPRGRRVYVQMTNGRSVRLAAVTRADLPRLIAASGHALTPTDVAAADTNGPRHADDPGVGEPDALGSDADAPMRRARHAAPDDTRSPDADETTRSTLAGQ